MLLQKFMDFEPDSQSLSCRQVAAILYLCFPLYFPVKLSECTDFGMVCVKHSASISSSSFAVVLRFMFLPDQYYRL